VAAKTYHVAVLVDGRSEKIEGPRYATREEAERELRVVTEAQQRGSDAVVALSWLSVKERLIAAAFIQERWVNTGPAVARRRLPSWEDLSRDQ
jgi:hypothetical protein